MKSRISKRIRVLSLISIAIGGFLFSCRFVVPQHSWNEDWGPLVSHETFPGDCSLCHYPERWDLLKPDFEFDHEAETGYPLVAAHGDAQCLRCHNDRGPVAEFAAWGCRGCHADTHQNTLGTDCERCHSQENWQPIGVVADHALTRFPLFGVHAVTPCALCHERADANDFRGAPVECEVCHQTDMQQASFDHVAAGAITDCERCHTPSGWGGAFVDHTFFPLLGGHAGHDCSVCHGSSGSFSGLDPACFSCHADDYAGAPDHVANGFSTTCQDCHTIFDWDAAVDHSAFPLVGGHAAPDCTDCHGVGSFIGLDPTCYSCHSADYDTAPDHLTLSFSTTCEDCHTIFDWDSTFVHGFPLQGNHNRDCTDCHISGTTASFSCDGTCHEHNQTDVDNDHDEVNGYSYDFAACVTCHPDGEN